MSKKLRTLVVEDSATDAELTVRALQRHGYEVTWTRVDTEPEFVARLAESFDLILSDYALPQFNGLRALELVRERGLLVPFIIVSGTIGEETAVAAIRGGASDYLIKDRLGRLGTAVERALAELGNRREKERLAAAQRESEQRLQLALVAAGMGVWTWDLRTNAVYWSPECHAIMGVPDFDGTLEGFARWVHAEDRDRVMAAISQAVDNPGGLTIEFRLLNPRGKIRWLASHGQAFRDTDGRALHLTGTVLDITTRKELEEQFLRSQRLEAIGTLASGIAHDLNNILAPMLMVAPILRRKLAEEHDRELVNIVEHGAQRGANIIKQLLTFSRGVAGHRGPIQIRHLLKDMLAVMGETFPREIEFENQLPGDLWLVNANATQMQQVMMNLCVNARDAIRGPGKITVGAENVSLKAEQLAGRSEVQPGPFVRFFVEDTGVGIPAANLTRIFEPFFTTKEFGKGTGLGLSTVAGIVRGHNGFVTVTSAPGNGSTFFVHLPALPEATETVVTATERDRQGKGETVLVVDDEAPIRNALRQCLESRNYQVLLAADGEEGLARFLAHRLSISLVLTDVMMPKINGVELVRSLRQLEPGLPIVAMTGMFEPGYKEAMAALGVTRILAKPCDNHELLAAVLNELAEQS